MTRACAIERLLVLPQCVAEAELRLLALEELKQEAAEALQQREDDLLLVGSIDGKNSDLRAAKMRALTAAERHRLEEIARRIQRQRVSIHHLQNEHSSLRSIARMLGPGSREVEL